MIQSPNCGMTFLGKPAPDQLMVGDIFNRPFIHNPQIITDASYERLVALFVGSYYVTTLDEVMPRVTDEDLLKTRDNLG